jgi:anti-anti-sigma factor
MNVEGGPMWVPFEPTPPGGAGSDTSGWGLHGSIDASNAEAMRHLLGSRVPATARHVVVDLSPASLLDSAGIRMLVNLGRDFERKDQHLVLVAAPGTPADRVLTISGMREVLALHEDLDEVMRGLAEHH